MNHRENYVDEKKWADACLRQKRRYYGKTAFRYPKRRWTCDEDRIILAHKNTDTELSIMLERSVAAIQKRRCVLKNQL